MRQPSGAGFQPAGRFLIGPIPGAYASSAAPHSGAVHLYQETSDVPLPTQEAAGTIKAIGERSTRIAQGNRIRSEEHTSELQSHSDLVCRLLLEKKKILARCRGRTAQDGIYEEVA